MSGLLSGVLSGLWPVTNAAAQSLTSWAWSEKTCITLQQVPQQLTWIFDPIDSPQTVQTASGPAQWTVNAQNPIGMGLQAYSVWVQPPVGPPLDFMATSNGYPYIYAGVIATAAGEWCGWARANGTYIPPGSITLRAPGKPIVKGH